jgi:glycosyltransferase involved in cell wall biosynthesis
MSYFPAFKCDTAAQEKFNRGGQDMTEMLRLQYEGKIDSWAIRFCYAHHAHDMRCIYPTRTMVKNIGLDHSGTHSKPDPRFFHPALDENWRPQQLCPANEMDDDIVRRYRAIFNPPIPFEGRRLLGKVKGRLRPWARLVRELAARAKRVLLRPIQDVDILIVNTYQKNGGAARAAWRTYCGIRTNYPGAAYLTLFRDDWSPGVIGLFNTSVRGAIAQRLVRLDQRPLNAYPDRLSVFFSPAVYPNPLRVPLTRYRPKLAHLHWVGHGLLRVEEIGRLRCPIVWTLHDTWAFTGGCHYTSDCVGFKKECGHCPQLGSSDDEDLSRMLMRRKAKAFRDLNLTIVTPSQWLAKLAERSSLFAGRRIEVIPNGLDTNAFAPVSRTAARAYLRLPDELPVILFGAHWLLDPRKGSDLLCEALSILAKKCTLLTFGEGQLQLSSSHNVRSIPLGNLTDAASLALAYSAADVFVCPSREDNLPNTVAEALACGTPCVAFDVNGLPDMITHKVNGWLASPFDPSALADGILWILSHPNPDQLSRAARAKAVAEYSLDVMSSRYGALYSELLAGGRQ